MYIGTWKEKLEFLFMSFNGKDDFAVQACFEAFLTSGEKLRLMEQECVQKFFVYAPKKQSDQLQILLIHNVLVPSNVLQPPADDAQTQVFVLFKYIERVLDKLDSLDRSEAFVIKLYKEEIQDLLPFQIPHV